MTNWKPVKNESGEGLRCFYNADSNTYMHEDRKGHFQKWQNGDIVDANPANQDEFLKKPHLPEKPPVVITGRSTSLKSQDAGKPGAYEDLIRQASEKYNVPPKLIKAVISQESGWNPNAVNGTSGCTGLMQLHPKYFHGNLKDPATNIDLGTKELSRLLTKYRDPAAALAYYNGGEYSNINAIVPGQDITPRQYAQQVLNRM